MQAAREASLIPDQPESGPDADRQPSSARARRWWHLGLLAALVALVVDLVTKHLAQQRLADGQPRRVVGELLRLQLAHNAGAAFSTGRNNTVIISLVAIVASIVVVWFCLRARNVLWALALGLLLGGILGNLADRLFRPPGVLRGQVVDFLELPHWPIFNVADMCINVAAVLIVIQALRGVRLDGSRSAAEES